MFKHPLYEKYFKTFVDYYEGKPIQLSNHARSINSVNSYESSGSSRGRGVGYDDGGAEDIIIMRRNSYLRGNGG